MYKLYRYISPILLTEVLSEKGTWGAPKKLQPLLEDCKSKYLLEFLRFLRFLLKLLHAQAMKQLTVKIY